MEKPLSRYRLPSRSVAMPPVPLDAGQIAQTLSKMDSDLLYLLDHRQVEEQIQGQLGASGYLSMSLFTIIGDDRTQVRDVFNTDLGGDPSENGLDIDVRRERRRQQASVVDCREAAKKRITKRDSLEAEQRASRMPFTIPVTEHVAMRLDFERDHGRKKNDEYPAAPYLEARFEQVDTGDLLAENLQDVVSRDEHQDDPQGASIDKDGRLRLKTTMKKVSLPRNSEELSDWKPSPGQHIDLDAIQYMAEVMEDPDAGVIRTYKAGVRVGVGVRLPGPQRFSNASASGESKATPSRKPLSGHKTTSLPRPRRSIYSKNFRSSLQSTCSRLSRSPRPGKSTRTAYTLPHSQSSNKDLIPGGSSMMAPIGLKLTLGSKFGIRKPSRSLKMLDK